MLCQTVCSCFQAEYVTAVIIEGTARPHVLMAGRYKCFLELQRRIIFMQRIFCCCHETPHPLIHYCLSPNIHSNWEMVMIFQAASCMVLYYSNGRHSMFGRSFIHSFVHSVLRFAVPVTHTNCTAILPIPRL